MGIARFYVDPLPESGTIELPPNEAHHAVRVLRGGVGDLITLFDGHGWQANARIDEVTKRSVIARIESRDFAPRDHNDKLHFAIALPKGDRQRNVIEKLVELGADSLTPITTHRSVARVTDANTDKLNRYVMEACKQCCRNRLMTINEEMHLDELLQRSTDRERCMLHPATDIAPFSTIPEADWSARERPPNSLEFIIGPEGGFSDDEVLAASQSQVRLLSLGERIQRVETAVATAAVLGHLWLNRQ